MYPKKQRAQTGILCIRTRLCFRPSQCLLTEHNKVVTVCRKEADGSWKDIVDMWNADPSQQNKQ
jgi:hypothetical protein